MTRDMHAPPPRQDPHDWQVGRSSQRLVSPLTRRMLLNLWVWFPPLANAWQRNRQVRYAARDYRLGGIWRIDLPRRCWRSGATEGLMPRIYEFDVRAFESPIPIIVMLVVYSVVLALLLLFFPIWFVNLLKAWLIGVAVTAVMIFIKSRQEGVQLSLFTLPEHADALHRPDVVIHDEALTLLLPDEAYAEAARVEVVEHRRAAQKYVGQGAAVSAATFDGRAIPEAAQAKRREASEPIALADTVEQPQAEKPVAQEPAAGQQDTAAEPDTSSNAPAPLPVAPQIPVARRREVLPPIKLDD